MEDKTMKLEREASSPELGVNQQIPLNQVPANIRMPEQLSYDELVREVTKLRNIVKQADMTIQQYNDAYAIKRMEFLFEIIKHDNFDPEVRQKASDQITLELGLATDTVEENIN